MWTMCQFHDSNGNGLGDFGGQTSECILVICPIDCTQFILDCCFIDIFIDELWMLLFSFILCSLYLFRTPNELTMDALVCPPLHYMSPARPYATALASMPGSGNTWLRHLLQEATRK